MDNRALEYSRRGDELFDEVAARFPDSRRRRLAIDHTLPRDRFEQIRFALMGYLSACLQEKRILLDEAELLARLEEGRGSLRNYDRTGLLLPKREHILEFNLLHKSVAAAFQDLRLDGVVDTIDLPVNVRMVYGKIDPERMKFPYSSVKLHTDVWAGVPADAVVVVMPVLGDIEHITIELGEMAPEEELPNMKTLADYSDGRHVQIAVPYGDVTLQHGHAYLADARLLHRTVRTRREGVRISIDFRFRMRPDEAYRGAVDVKPGFDSMVSTTSYREWLRVGTESLMVFDESVETVKPENPDALSPAFPKEYRTVALLPGA